MPDCLNCGKCCYYLDEIGNLHKCKFLVKLKTRTFCRVYSTRLGRLLYKKGNYEVRCFKREDVKVNYEGCPYNK